MHWGLPGITEVNKLDISYLREISPEFHNHHEYQNHCLHVILLAYLDVMQDANV